MSEVNIDAALVRGGAAALSRTEERLVEMTNGCICCTLRDDLLEEVDRLAREGRFDYLLIESNGISEPMPVAATCSSTVFRAGRAFHPPSPPASSPPTSPRPRRPTTRSRPGRSTAPRSVAHTRRRSRRRSTRLRRARVEGRGDPPHQRPYP